MSVEILFNLEKTNIKNKEDAFVCCLHSYLIGSGYKCIANGEEIPKENVKKSDMLPCGWSSNNMYALVYQHETTGEKYLLKILKFDETLLVHFMRTKDDKVTSLEINPSDYVSSNLSTFETAYSRLDQLKKRFQDELLNPFEAKMTASSRPVVDSSRTERDRHSDPLRVPCQRPGWEERPNPCVEIGRSDLDPLAGGIGGGMVFDPMRSGFPPSAGGYGPSGIGGPTRLPRGAVPPGARFDPFGPPDIDPSGSIRPDYRNQRAGPDPDHLPPPGYDDMFM